MQKQASCFEILDHPADMGFRAWAPNLPDLFAECGRAVTSILVDLEAVSLTEQTAVEILGDDLESLLYNWLAEILYLFDGEKKLFGEFVIVNHKNNDGTEFLQAELNGERFSPEKHQIKTYVKAVTFHQLSIVHNEEGYTAQVYLDI